MMGMMGVDRAHVCSLLVSRRRYRICEAGRGSWEGIEVRSGVLDSMVCFLV